MALPAVKGLSDKAQIVVSTWQLPELRCRVVQLMFADSSIYSLRCLIALASFSDVSIGAGSPIPCACQAVGKLSSCDSQVSLQGVPLRTLTNSLFNIRGPNLGHWTLSNLKL